ncbi:alpha,alpha-phosphotrehalase [Terrilactibacillus sp. BCM23-1]|uniref:oligo-1,6-glucosidase n=1 Tax=Terrilactibacillus tamarindi TaxID=2599694 RepID=A0A6N8CQ27_9BACI|nr:alpha-glucosidase [Terrilactibacillus tamarindi]MTT31768.1 alpha,alpha-phosphotrehalase [Terrilactibacillus tamarindi]
MQKQWWKESVVYQIYPRSFNDSNNDGIGDLQGIISKLDYIKFLGANVIWICPVYSSPNDDNGYDISDYKGIMDVYGTMEDWEQLLEEIHQRDMKLIMDLVPNHTSDEHPWFIESRSSKNNPKRDWYYWRPGKDGKEPNNWESIFLGSAWQYDDLTDEYYLHLFSKKQPDLNWENPEVREALYNMITWWLNKGIDGFRIDAITFIKKKEGLPDAPNLYGTRYVPAWDCHRNQPGIQNFLSELKEKVFDKYDIMTVGEADGVDPEGSLLYVDETQGKFNMIFHFEHMGLDSGPNGKWDVVPWQLKDLKKVMTRWQVGLHEKGWNANYLENHDQPRSVSRFGDDKKYYKESAKMLATFLMTLQGTPYIYQGQEIGMTNVRFESIDDYRDVESLNLYRENEDKGNESIQKALECIYAKGRDNARTPMQWNDQINAGFTEGTPWISVNPNYKEINVEKSLNEKDSIFHYYKELIQLRKEHEVLIYGDYHLILEDDDQIYAYIRSLEDEAILVILNFSEKPANFVLPEDLGYTSQSLLIANKKVSSNGKLNMFTLHPYEARVYKLTN